MWTGPLGPSPVGRAVYRAVRNPSNGRNHPCVGVLWSVPGRVNLRGVAATTDDALSTRTSPLRRADGRRIVGERTLGVIRALAESIFATEQGPPPAERLDWVRDEMEDFLARAGAQSRVVYQLSLLAVSVLAPALIGKPGSSLARLPLDERTRALVKLEHGPFAPTLLAAKAMLCVVYYEHPDAAADAGYDGECMSGARATSLPVLDANGNEVAR